ncbi:MAG: putative rane protein [Planctomycetaceae bacterium]|nr:putative rane protein [Planctomycetaceae bacterium]
MPRPTVAPIVLALGLIVLAAGVPLGLPFLFVGALVLVTGLSFWVGELLPGRGHFHERLVAATSRPMPVLATLAGVDQLRSGMPGYRARLPEAVHPISAGVKGGVIGGLVMPIPALLYGVLSGHGIWYPINLLAGTVLPSIGTMTTTQLEHFSLPLLLTGIVIHATMSVGFGLLYGVLLPMLPAFRRLAIPGSLAWGGLILPLLWTGISHGLMGVANPVLQARVDWPWFILSQFVFGIVAAFVVSRSEKIAVPPAGSGAG